MSDRFTALNARLLASYGGDVTLTRLTAGPPPAQPWDPPSDPVLVSEALPFIATDVASELLASGVVLVDDLYGVLAVPSAELAEPQVGDTVTASGTAYTVLTAKPVHSAAGQAIHYALHARTA